MQTEQSGQEEMMVNDAEETDGQIADLKRMLGADTDAELARLLSIDKRTVSAWRARQSVPKRFLELLNGEGKPEKALGTIIRMSDLDQRAFSLALFRYTRTHSEIFLSGDYRQIWEHMPPRDSFWEVMLEARRDLIEAMRERAANNAATALALVLHDDLDEMALPSNQ